MSNIENQTYYSERRAARKLGVTRTTLRRHRFAGRLKALTLGGAVLYSENALEEWQSSFRGRSNAGV